MKTYKVETPNGVFWAEGFESLSRGGTLSPQLFLILYKGRRITPYEQRVKGYKVSAMVMLKFYYREPIIDLLYQDNPFLKAITKKDTWTGAYIPIPLKG